MVVTLAAEAEGKGLGSSEAEGLVEAAVVAVVAVTAAAEAAAAAKGAAAAAEVSVAAAYRAAVTEESTFCGRAESSPRRRWVEPDEGHRTRSAPRLKRLAQRWRLPDAQSR